MPRRIKEPRPPLLFLPLSISIPLPPLRPCSRSGHRQGPLIRRMGGFAPRGMVGDTPPDPLRFGDTLSIDSSTGWTDEKHMLYISSLELSFVTKLYDGQVDSNGLFSWSPSVLRHKTHNGNYRNTQVVDQVDCGMIEVDGAESRVSQAEHTESPSCDVDQLDRKAYYMDDNTSTSDARQDGVRYYERRKNSGGSSTSYLHWHVHSLSGTELSDQNFVDDETEVSNEQRRVPSNKRLKHAADTTSSPAAPSASANSQQDAIHHVEVDCSVSSSDFDIGSLHAGPASCESHGSRRWSV